MRFFTPIICLATGFYGGDFHCVAPSVKSAFEMLERRIASGKIRKRLYR